MQISARSLRTVLLFFLLLTTAWTQQFRSSITGRVLDPQHAAVARVKVSATEIATQAVFTTLSNESGQYTVPLLPPGAYRLEAEAPGFRRYVREALQVNANQPVGLDISLEVGQISETVNVTEEAPILDTATSSVGQAISSEFIGSFPLNGRSPLSLAQIAFGVIPTADPLFQRPFDNSRLSSFSMGGAPAGTNEILLDGSPDTTSGRLVAFSPPVDAVVEVKAESFQMDAAYGNTGGGTVNIVSKAGTNSLHGSAYEFNQVAKTAATDFFVNRSGQKKTNLVYNQFGVTAGGPVWLPRVFNGRNRVFWFFAYEGIKHINPEPVTTTVPTSAERQGNFSQLLAVNNSYQIYDPLSGVKSGTRISRQPFAGNLIPASRFNPIALKYLEYYPLPNQAGQSDGSNNYLANSTRRENFNAELGRIDFNLSDRHKFFANFRHNERLQDRGNYFKNIATGNFLNRINWGGTFDDVYTFTPTLFLDTRVNWTRYTDGGYRPSLGFDQTSLGFPAALAAASPQAVLPQVSIGSYNALGTTGNSLSPFDQYQLFSSLTRVAGGHTLKLGGDVRVLRESASTPGSSSGSYTFGTNWTRGPLDNSAAAPIGQDLSAFLLGLPTAGQFDIASFRSNQASYYAGFFQDDWRVRGGLTLNLGIRYEKELPTTERYNRQLVGFDSAAVNSVTLAARQAYASIAQPELPAAQFQPLGGAVFTTAGHRGATGTSSRLFSPRAGFAWTPAGLGRKSVVRGGFGIFYFSDGLLASSQPGYFQTTQLTATLDSYLTPAATLSDPFPSGILQPVGASLGVNTFLGQTVSFYNPNLRTPYSLRWNLTTQRQLSPNLVLELGYMGNHAVRLTGSRGLDTVPRQYLSISPVRDQTVIDRLSANVANPFSGLLPGTSLNGSTIALSQLLRPFPQFSGDSGVQLNSDNFGSSYFHAFQARLERRLARGVTWLANYQFSRTIEKRSYLNPSDPSPEKRVSNEDRPHRLVFSSVYQLPTGKHQLFSGVPGAIVRQIVGGWSVSGAYTYASGAPLTWGNVIYYGGDLHSDPRAVNGAFDVTRFNRVSAQQLANNIRTFPSQFSNLRQDGTNNIDLSLLKDFALPEHARLQFRTDFFNTLNHPQFGAPNTSPTNSAFGTISAQYNLPRAVQMALRLVW